MHQLNVGQQLGFNLIGGDEKVGIVLRETADPGHARQLAGLLEPVDRTELRQPHGQVSVAAGHRLVDLDVVRAVHRLEQVPFLLLQPGQQGLGPAGGILGLTVLGNVYRVDLQQLGNQPFGRLHLALRRDCFGIARNHQTRLGQKQGHVPLAGLIQQAGLQSVLAQVQGAGSGVLVQRRELGVAVVGEVTAGAVHVELADMRGVNRAVAPAGQLIAEELLQKTANQRAARHPQDQTGTGQRANGEQVQLLAQQAMVALFRLFQLLQIGIQILLGEKGGRVQTLQLLAGRVALPVGPSQRHQLEGANLAGVGQVGAAAQVDELALAIEAERILLAEFLVDVLDLELLPHPLHQGTGFRRDPFEALERLGRLDDLAHLLLDAREIFLADRGGGIYVVVEAVFQGGAKRQLGTGKQAQHRPGHDVGARMPQYLEGLGIAVRQQFDFEFSTFGQGQGEVGHLAIHHRSNRRLGQSLANPLGQIHGGGSGRKDFGRAVRKRNGRHENATSMQTEDGEKGLALNHGRNHAGKPHISSRINRRRTAKGRGNEHA